MSFARSDRMTAFSSTPPTFLKTSADIKEKASWAALQKLNYAEIYY
jgi:hypothetical protein